jgi:ribonuclease P protein component
VSSAPALDHASPAPVPIWRITDRRSFAALRRDGARARRGPISVLHRATPTPHPRIAFALSRDVGGAVDRNRLRRRLRASCRELERAGALPAGDYLIRAGRGALALDARDLAAQLRSVLRAVAAPARDPRPSVER